MSIEPMAIETRPPAVNDGLRRIARALSERLPTVDTLPLIAEESRLSLEAATVVVGLCEEGGFLRFAAVSGARAHELQGVRVRTSESVADRALRTGQPTLVLEDSDSRTEPPDSGPAVSLAFPTCPSVAVAPIERAGEPVGALLAMSWEAATPFLPADLETLSLFADCTAAALASDETERVRADQARELSVLYRASRSVGASLNLQEILDSVLDSVCEQLDFLTAVVFLANDEQTHLFVAAERGLVEPDHEIQLSAESAAIAEILTSRRPKILTRAEDLPEFGVFVRDERIRAAMVAPILSRAQCHGVLVVTSPQPENFTANDLTLLEAVAAHAGTAISNAWLYEDATQRAEHSGALYDLSQRLNASLNADHIYALAVESVHALLNADTAGLLVFDKRSDRLDGRAARGLHAEGLKEFTAPVGRGIPGWVFEWETPQAVASVAADSRNATAPLDGCGIVSLLAAPMAAGERVMGVLLATTGHRRLFTVGEMELLYTVANQTAGALSNAELYAQARSKAAEMRRYFRRVARALGETVQGDDVPGLFANLALALMGASVCNVYAIRDDGLHLRATADDRANANPDERVGIGEGLTGTVARKGQHLAIEDLTADPRASAHPWASRHRFASYLGVPIREGREVRGVVELFSQDPHANMREEARLLAHFARLARVAERLQ